MHTLRPDRRALPTPHAAALGAAAAAAGPAAEPVPDGRSPGAAHNDAIVTRRVGVCRIFDANAPLACLLPPTADGDAEYGKPSTGSTTCMELCEYPRPSAEWVACLFTGERWLSPHLYREA